MALDKSRLSSFQKINRGLEIFWLILSIACVILASYFVYDMGYDEAKWYLLFPLLAFAMYIMRRGFRKRYEAQVAAFEEQERAKSNKNKN